MKTLALSAALLCLASGAALAQQPRSIVGEWAQESSDCGTQFAYIVEPKGIANDELMCEFDTVRRDGPVVTWTGRCGKSLGAKEVVVATDRGNRLNIEFKRSGLELTNLLRCPKRR